MENKTDLVSTETSEKKARLVIRQLLPILENRAVSLLIWKQSGAAVDLMPYSAGIIFSCSITYVVFFFYYLSRLAPMPLSAMNLYVLPNALSFAVTALYGSIISFATVHIANCIRLRWRKINVLLLALGLSYFGTTILRVILLEWAFLITFGSDPLSRTFLHWLGAWFFYYGLVGLSGAFLALLGSGIVRYSKWYQKLCLKMTDEEISLEFSQRQMIERAYNLANPSKSEKSSTTDSDSSIT